MKRIETAPRGASGHDDADGEPVLETTARLVYVICTEKDRKATIPIRKACKQRGLDVALPAFEGDASQVRNANEQLLATCDGVMLFYGAGDESWKRTIDNELKRMAGYREGKPLARRATPTSPRRERATRRT